MNDYKKYAFNGEWFFENAREHMERNDFPWIPIGMIGDVFRWEITLIRDPFNERELIVFISTPNEKPKVKCRLHSEFLRNDGSCESETKDILFMEPRGGGVGIFLNLDEMDDEKNGYLKDGGIEIHYGFQIEGILGKNDIWTFNIYDPLFDCEEKQNMITFYFAYDDLIAPEFFYSHKQLLTFHSTYFKSDSNGNLMIELNYVVGFEEFLQISNGVRFQETCKYFYLDVLKFARKYKLFNVVSLVDEAMKLMDFELTFSDAIYYGLNHRLASSLRAIKTSKKLAEGMKQTNLETVSGESLKKCVKRFFEMMDEEFFV
uniref:BTB domain-containing protein n=1 Tax=Caenorhabditis tropicalis TaxID=1561998 RepID=A0A1I7UKS3_9PELO